MLGIKLGLVLKSTDGTNEGWSDVEGLAVVSTFNKTGPIAPVW